jgi:hypothetical protein
MVLARFFLLVHLVELVEQSGGCAPGTVPSIPERERHALHVAAITVPFY